MARTTPAERANGAKQLVNYSPPAAAPKPISAADRMAADLAQLIQGLPGLIAAAVKTPTVYVPAPIVNVEAPNAPEVKVNSPVYVNPPDVRVPPVTVHVPEGKTPAVTVEPPTVQLTVRRPTKWRFRFSRNEYGQLIEVVAEALERE